MRAGLLPLFGLSEISVITGLQSLWASDVFLALVVTVFALFAPISRPSAWPCCIAACSARAACPRSTSLGKLAMADIFLIALYITLTKGIGVGRIEVAWGLYLFTACILASILDRWRTANGAQPCVQDSA